MDSRLSCLLEGRIPWRGCRDTAQLGGMLFSTPFHPAVQTASRQTCTCSCHGAVVGAGDRARCVGSQHLSLHPTAATCIVFLPLNQMPINNRQTPLMSLTKKRGFPSQAGGRGGGEGREISPTAKHSKIGKHFLDSKQEFANI